MRVPCDKCETPDFCSKVERCIDYVLTDHYGEAEMEDQEELPAEEVELDMPDFEQDVFNNPLTKRERTIISRAINGF